MTYQVIYKYSVEPILCTFFHMMPKGAAILCVQMQDGTPQIWALVDPDAEEERREFLRVGTGWESEKISVHQYRGTYQDPPFVWHLFEI